MVQIHQPSPVHNVITPKYDQTKDKLSDDSNICDKSRNIESLDTIENDIKSITVDKTSTSQTTRRKYKFHSL